MRTPGSGPVGPGGRPAFERPDAAPWPPSREVLRRCADGEISPAIALLRLIMAGGNLQAVRSALRRHEREPDVEFAVASIRQLLDEHAEGSATVLRLLEQERGRDQIPALDELERCRQRFDLLVGLSPEASVALYSFGSGEMLSQATREVVALLDRLRVLADGREVLEIGCGIGRFQAALAGRVARLTGIDIAAGMIAAAKRRCTGLPNVRLLQTSGRDLSPFPSRSFDLVLAIDTLPYIYGAGFDLVSTHFREVARALRGGGDFVILNVSYRGDLERDRADVRRLAREAKLEVLRDATRDLSLWDAATFHLRKPDAARGTARP